MISNNRLTHESLDTFALHKQSSSLSINTQWFAAAPLVKHICLEAFGMRKTLDKERSQFVQKLGSVSVHVARRKRQRELYE